MFNRTYVHTTNAAPYPQEIKEIRAPTDDSIRILSEVETKMLDRVVANGIINMAEVTSCGSFIFSQFESAFIFNGAININGHNHPIKVKIDRNEFNSMDRDSIGKILLEHCTKAITEIIAKNLSYHLLSSMDGKTRVQMGAIFSSGR